MLRNNLNKEIKKSVKKLISVVLAFTVSAGMCTVSAYGAAQGTAANPYMISTASQLQAVNNDPDAHYRLAGNIDLSGLDFEPIGNVDAGPFTGSFDGNGYTISNLTVDSGKYAGLFGYNEGQVTDVTLSKVSVQGTKYVGGVVAYNDETGTVSQCEVKSGKIKAADGLSEMYVGGVVGYNSGTFEGYSYNGANINADDSSGSIYAGGIIGYSSSAVSFSADNKGNITAQRGVAGGIIGYGSKLNLHSCINFGDVYGREKAAGIVAAYGNCTVYKCGNNGDITAVFTAYGIYADRVSNSYNTGKIKMRTQGIDYKVSGIRGTVVESSFNSGYIDGDYVYSCGICGTISNSYNNGNVKNTGGWNVMGVDNAYLSYNSGNIEVNGHVYSYQNQIRSANMNSYSLAGAYPGSFDASTRLSAAEFRKQSSFAGFDFENIWTIDSKFNSGFPTLRNVNTPLMLNRANDTLITGDTVQLIAYKHGTATENVSWEVVNGNASVTPAGRVTAVGTGGATISCRDSEGNRANYNIYIVSKNASAKLGDFTVNVADGTVGRWVTFGGSSTNDFIINATSSDKSVAKVSVYSDDGIHVTPLKSGTAVLSFETAAGAKGSCTVTVIDVVKKISLDKESMTIARGNSSRLTATTAPATTSSKVSWSSSATDVATVDQNGNVKGIGKGTAVIKAATDNGYYAQCTVTVNAPITSMSFEKSSVTVYKDDIVNLKLNVNPSDTTDSVTYSGDSYYYNYVSFSEEKLTGVKVTGNKLGSVIVTAKSTSGVIASCTVRVIDYPVIVTDISLNEAEHSAKVGEVFKLNADVTPSNATNKKVTWESTDETVASVSETGTVTAVGAGKTIITATSSNGIIAYCDVTVKGVASTNLSKIYIPKIVITDEEYVDIPVMIERNPGISFASLNILYNSDKLEAESVINGDIFESVLGSIDKNNAAVRLDFTSEENKTDNGILAKIRFKVKAGFADNADIKVCYYPGEIRNIKMNSVSFNLMDGMLRSSKQSRIEGNIYSADDDNEIKVVIYDADMDNADIKADLVLDSPEKGELIELTDVYNQDGKEFATPYSVDLGGREVKLAVYKEGYGAHIETVKVDCLTARDFNLYLLGDANGDGKIRIGDKAVLARAVAGWTGYDKLLKEEAADINGDGKIDSGDRMLLERHLAGWSRYKVLEYGMNIKK